MKASFRNKPRMAAHGPKAAGESEFKSKIIASIN